MLWPNWFEVGVAISGGAALGLVGGAITLAIALGGAIAVMFAYLRKTTKDILRQENGDLKDRLGTVEKENSDLKARLASAEATIATLTNVVTGASAVAELKQIVDLNQQTIMAKLNEMGS